MSRPPSSNGKRFGSKNGNMSFLTVSICNSPKKVKRVLKMSVEIQDHSAEVSAEIKAALLRGLEKCGLVAEGYAKRLCPVDTGNLRNSITHMIDEQEPAAIIGTISASRRFVISMPSSCFATSPRPLALHSRLYPPPKGIHILRVRLSPIQTWYASHLVRHCSPALL
jgi:hypothetical protein